MLTDSFTESVICHSIYFITVLLIVHHLGAASRVILRGYCIFGVLLLLLVLLAAHAPFDVSGSLAHSLPHLADDD